MESLNLKKINSFIAKYWVVLLSILAIPSIWALIVPGFFGASDDLHVAWLYELDKVLNLGQIPPRFVPDLSFGFGYPLFNFVFPLPFYIGEVFHLLSFSFVDSVKIVFGISLVFSTYGMYLLLREFSDEFLSLVGALIYLYTPYRSNDVYNRGAFGESLAFVFLPVLALSVIKAAKNSSIKWVGVGALSLAGLILTHNITTYMFFPFILILGFVFVFLSKERVSSFLKTASLIILGLLSGIYFWLPALIDSSLMKYDTVFNFIDHFPTLLQLIKPNWSYGASVAGPYDGMSFFLGVGNLILLLGGGVLTLIFWKKYSKDQKAILIWSFLSFFLTIFMMNYRSSFLWSNLPMLPYFQFPWRFLIMTTFLVPFLIITFKNLKYSYFFSGGLLILVVLLNLNVFRPHDFLGRTDQYYLNRYIPVPVAQKEYLETQEEYLRLPKKTVQRPDKNYPLLTSEMGEIKNEKVNGLSIQFQTSFNSATIVNYNKYYFPGWYATVDSLPLPIHSGTPFGQISTEIPKGEHVVRIDFKETLFKSFLNIISLIAIIISCLLLSQKLIVKLKKLISTRSF